MNKQLSDIKKDFWKKTIVPKEFNDEHYWVINKAIDFTYRKLKKSKKGERR